MPRNAKVKIESLGNGIYGIPEAARYARINSQRVRSWFKPQSIKGKSSLLNGDYKAVDNNFAVSFLNLTDVLVVGRFHELGVSLQTIRAAYEILIEELDTPHPFSHTKLSTDGERIFITIADDLSDEKLSDLISKQHFFPSIMERYLQQLDYCKETGLASRWRIADGVVIDPAISYGKPVIQSTGLTTYVLSNNYFANGQDENFVAELFDVSSADVLHAVAFEEEYSTARAA